MKISRPRIFAIIASFAIMFVSSASLCGQVTKKIPMIPEREKLQTNTSDNSGGGSTIQNASYDKETFDSIYGDTGYDEFGGYSRYISPYLNCYGKKHNIPENTIDMWPKMHGGTSEESLALGQQRLAELEAKLKARMRSFPHTGLHAGENPGLVYEIASKRAEYLQCLRDGSKAAADAEETARGERMADIFFDDLAAARKEVSEYSPSTKIWLVSSKNSEWLDRAISKGWRKEFYHKWKFPAATVAKFDAQFDALAADAPPKITAYTNSQVNKFAFRNAVEERMMRSQLNDVSGLIVHKIGFYQSTWNIEKNDLGIPIRRYKTGAIYGRNPNSDHPYCMFWTINIVQDYAGGGTYGTSYAKYKEREVATCPGR